MYKLVLILKYLRRKLAPLFAAVAVTLCTAMVIIVMSVMGGFLEQFRISARNLTGDVIVEGPFQGFAGYDELLDQIEDLPEIAVGTPSIEAFGLINFGDDAKPVRIQGVNLAKFDQIVGYRKTLVWAPQELVKNLALPDHPRANLLRDQLLRDHPIEPPVKNGKPEAIIGIEVNPYHRRDENGQYSINNSRSGGRVALTVVPLTSRGTAGSIEPERKELTVVNEFKSGLYDIDGQYIFVPFTTLQKMLKMHQRQGIGAFDPETGEGGKAVTIPGRANRLILKAAPGIDVWDARNAVQDTINAFYGDNPFAATPRAATWEQVHGQFLGAVENEKGLMTFLFGLISLVATVMVATTFYMIVLEKTRDIGVLRALGASRGGILGLFLGYGLAIGLVGSLIGLAIAIAVVTNLNGIQALLDAWFGWKMWDPQTYFFDKIPSVINYTEALTVVAGAILSSVLGAALPAILAARLKPVDALRYE